MSPIHHKLNPTPLCHRLAQMALLIALTIGLPLASRMPATAAPAFQVTFDCSTVTEIPQAECLALVALYNSTNGAGWSDNTDWLSNIAPCSWYGVGCYSEFNDVIIMDLPDTDDDGNEVTPLPDPWPDVAEEQVNMLFLPLVAQ